MDTLFALTGSGGLQIEGRPGTLLVAYKFNDPPPALVTYEIGEKGQEYLPEGNSTYLVPAPSSFWIGYDMGNCTSATISWLWQ